MRRKVKASISRLPGREKSRGKARVQQGRTKLLREKGSSLSCPSSAWDAASHELSGAAVLRAADTAQQLPPGHSANRVTAMCQGGVESHVAKCTESVWRRKREGSRGAVQRTPRYELVLNYGDPFCAIRDRHAARIWLLGLSSPLSRQCLVTGQPDSFSSDGSPVCGGSDSEAVAATAVIGRQKIATPIPATTGP